MKNKLMVLGSSLKCLKKGKEDYMCLTELYNLFGKSTTKNIETWSRNSSTMSFIDAWERKNNPDFKPYGVEGIDLSLAKWIEQTGAIGLYTVRGKFGGTYAHVVIALKFCSYLSAALDVEVFEGYLEYKQRERNGLKQLERQLAADNYRGMTKAVLSYLVPVTPEQCNAYASEADMINVILFGMKAQDWAKKYPELAIKQRNQRDYATKGELEVICVLQQNNSMLIGLNILKEERFKILKHQADSLKALYNKTLGIETKHPLSELE